MSECQHEREELRKVELPDGRAPQFKMQCLECGRTGPAIAYCKLTEIEKSFAPLVDFDLRERYWQERRAARQEEWEAQHSGKLTEWWERYAIYMASPEWAIRRQRVLQRDGYKCQSCLERPATQVHHLSYRHFGNEPLFELTAVCTPCHERITALDRSNGVATL